MTAIANIRRDLAEASWLSHSQEPNAGTVHNFRKPLRQRFNDRQYVGPYYWSPSEPHKGRGFYQASKGLYCDEAGSTFDLRLELANDHLGHGRHSYVRGYYCDEGCSDTLRPIIARLPHGRGFLAGWTMGAGMCAAIERAVYPDAESAAYAAHSLAEYEAEEMRVADPRNVLPRPQAPRTDLIMARIPALPYRVVVHKKPMSSGALPPVEQHNYSSLPGATSYRDTALRRPNTKRVEVILVLDESTPDHRE